MNKALEVAISQLRHAEERLKNSTRTIIRLRGEVKRLVGECNALREEVKRLVGECNALREEVKRLAKDHNDGNY